MRFNRDYELTIGIGAQQVVIKPPVRIVFDACKSINGGLNKITLKVYNLKEGTRLKLIKDKEDSDVYIPLVLKVGYADRLETIFKGSVFVGRNIREGAEYQSYIECQDGGTDYLTAHTSKTVDGGNVIDSLLQDLPNTAKGKITDIQALTRPKVLVGNTTKLIEQFVGDDETWYIDNEQLYIIKDGEVVSALTPVVSSDTGLLNTPENDLKKITFNTIMNPSLKIGGLCKLISKTAPHLSGIYKIETINYKGDNYGDDWIQSISGFLSSDYKVLK